MIRWSLEIAASPTIQFVVRVSGALAGKIRSGDPGPAVGWLFRGARSCRSISVVIVGHQGLFRSGRGEFQRGRAFIVPAIGPRAAD
jgi:hypothetical protein